jgi:NadR type nicotinamide-nucleotide adenylyltransferase
MLNKIAILGPESTGKSQLTIALASYFNAPYVPEMAREYLAVKGINYTYQDIFDIALLQQETEKKLQKLHHDKSFLICDTELITIKIWLEYKKWEVPNWIIEEIEKSDFTLYLLTDIDLPWQEDPLRENPNDRQELIQLFEKELNHFGKNYQIIKGSGDLRTQKAIEFIKNLIL